MKNLFAAAAGLLGTLGSLTGQAQTFTAARLQPNTSLLAVDAAGNSYVAGNIWRPTQFGATTLTPASVGAGGIVNDVFVAKLDAAGNYLWAVRAGGTSDDEASALTIDATGQVYLTGSYRGTASFGSLSLTAPSNGGAPGLDFFVAKLDANGNWQWATRAGSPIHAPTAIRLDGSGNVYVAGAFTAPTATIGTTTLSNPVTLSPPYNTPTYTSDGYVAKLNSAGAWQWVNQVGGNDYNFVDHRDMVVDAAGNCYVTGSITGQISFGATTLTSSVNNASLNRGFVAKLSPSGSWLWAVPAGADAHPNTGKVNKIALDGSGNAYITGEASGPTATFGAIALTTTAAARSWLFVAKLDAAGNYLWATKTGGTLHEASNGIAVDAVGNAFVTGSFLNETSFGSIALTGVPSGTINGVYDAFVAKLNGSTGAVQWAVRAGGEKNDYGRAVAVDGRGGVYLTGDAASTSADFGSFQLAPASVGGFWARLNDVALSTRAAAATPAFSLFPNPSRTATTVAGLPAGTPVALYDARGRCVSSHTVPATGTLQLPTVLPAGLYMVRAGLRAQPLLVE